MSPLHVIQFQLAGMIATRCCCECYNWLWRCGMVLMYPEQLNFDTRQLVTLRDIASSLSYQERNGATQHNLIPHQWSHAHESIRARCIATHGRMHKQQHGRMHSGHNNTTCRCMHVVVKQHVNTSRCMQAKQGTLQHSGMNRLRNNYHQYERWEDVMCVGYMYFWYVPRLPRTSTITHKHTMQANLMLAFVQRAVVGFSRSSGSSSFRKWTWHHFFIGTVNRCRHNHEHASQQSTRAWFPVALWRLPAHIWHLSTHIWQSPAHIWHSSPRDTKRD